APPVEAEKADAAAFFLFPQQKAGDEKTGDDEKDSHAQTAEHLPAEPAHRQADAGRVEEMSEDDERDGNRPQPVELRDPRTALAHSPLPQTVEIESRQAARCSQELEIFPCVQAPACPVAVRQRRPWAAKPDQCCPEPAAGAANPRLRIRAAIPGSRPRKER